jgi:eukaryotic-like serine/threonine-protein kinase
MKTVDCGESIEKTLVSGSPPPADGHDVVGAAQLSTRERDTTGPLTLVPGDVVAGRYRLGPVIGAGGMGIVYKAQHVELGTWVALKVIRPDIARNSSIWRRFSREARALAALHNKHVVRVHDAGTLESGLRYLVMELLVGTDLRRIIQRDGPLPAQRAVDYVSQVCSALGDAHRLHIIHRDIKPENIFLAQYRACEPTIKLLDFGVALFLDDTGQLTMPGRGVGSPQYLSPEQVQNASEVDQRSDIWAVGLLLYELLVGRSLFHGLNTAQICLKLSDGQVPRVEAAAPEVAAGLAAIIQRCLEIDPARRPQSVDELGLALEPFSSRHTQALPCSPAPTAEPASLPQRAASRRRGLMPRLFDWTGSVNH